MTAIAIQITFKTGQALTEVVDGEMGDFRGRFAVGEPEVYVFVTRDNGDLIVKASEVSFIRARPLAPDEDLGSFADLQRAFAPNRGPVRERGARPAPGTLTGGGPE